MRLSSWFYPPISQKRHRVNRYYLIVQIRYTVVIYLIWLFKIRLNTCWRKCRILITLIKIQISVVYDYFICTLPAQFQIETLQVIAVGILLIGCPVEVIRLFYCALIICNTVTEVFNNKISAALSHWLLLSKNISILPL